MDAPGVLRSTRRFVLLDASGEYRLVDRTVGEDPVETFPATEEGFDTAWERFSELVKKERARRGYPWLWIIVAAGTALWVVAGIASTSFFLADPFPSQGIFVVISVLEAAGFRLGVGGLLVMAALLARSRLAGPGVPSPLSRGATGSVETLFRWLLVAGLMAWIVGTVGDLFLAPDSFLTGGGIFRIEGPRTTAWIIVERLGFTVWMSSLVVLVLLWATRWMGLREEELPIPEA